MIKRALTPIIISAFLLGAASQVSLADGDHAPIGDAIKDVPIFDAHIHYKSPAWDEYPVSSIIELMDKSGVAMGLVSSSPDEGTIMMLEYAPNRVVPELRPYHGAANSSNWPKVLNMDTYLEDRLEKYPHEGIGEFHIHRLDTADEPFFRKVVAMAKARDIVVHVHSGPEPIRWLYSLDKDVKIIWAHAGLGEAASEVYKLMKENPKLLADTSLREFDIMGSDTWVNSQWARYESIIASNREWLSKLPRKIAEKIAYKNAEKHFNRKISMDQIGTR